VRPSSVGRQIKKTGGQELQLTGIAA